MSGYLCAVVFEFTTLAAGEKILGICVLNKDHDGCDNIAVCVAPDGRCFTHEQIKSGSRVSKLGEFELGIVTSPSWSDYDINHGSDHDIRVGAAA